MFLLEVNFFREFQFLSCAFFFCLQTQRYLEPPPLLPNSVYVDICELPSFEEMLGMIKNQKPVVIKGLVNQWPAFRKWK